ncbi:hypothetical protein WFJ45_24010, partial [Salmonella enterica subsp. enterica serovar Minnesota]|uniref:hypothetical protein n=1 Tax=Salmonella enterica TaxID=28901 RepID=UPI003D2D87DC
RREVDRSSTRPAAGVMVARQSELWKMRGGTSMNFQDKRIWYGVAAVILVLIIIWAMWPAGEVTPPAAPQ